MVEAAIGQVLESGVFACKESGERFIKVRTIIDFANPLRSQLMATSDDTGCFWVNLKYEYLPSFCYHCGRVGHARRDCTFAPPNRKERFGPHMSMKKFGRKIYKEEDESMRNRGPRQTVWVNRQINGPAKNDRTYVRSREAERQGAVKKAEFTSQLDREAANPPNNPTGIQEPSKITIKKSSPRGFAINKPARIQIGGKKIEPPRQENPNAGLQQNPVGEEASGPVLGPTSNCRPNQVEIEAHPLQHLAVGEVGVGQGGCPAAVTGLKKETGAGLPMQRSGHHLQKLAHPVKKENRRKAQATVGESSKRTGDSKRGSKAGPEQAKPVGCSGLDGEAPASVPSTEAVKALVSADSESEEEVQCFEIKKRLPAHPKELINTPRGHVSQMVAAFEAGLAINSGAQTILQERMNNDSPTRTEQSMIQEADSKLDEYGSNLMNPDIGTRKRPLEAVEGGGASLKWPQSDK
ncbi:unnamed protein product [Linum trigynum]|uniref:CCHC-type domain-containing protein n=1 Tax=Linum trigynum TaxID=586398 RepID=A0AAV2G896_9ROSI